MYYFVITADGSRYGPADIDTLVGWVGEGRIVASTMLIERGTEREVGADSITAISAALRRRSGQGPAVAVERDASAGDVGGHGAGRERAWLEGLNFRAQRVELWTRRLANPMSHGCSS